MPPARLCWPHLGSRGPNARVDVEVVEGGQADVPAGPEQCAQLIFGNAAASGGSASTRYPGPA